MKKMADTLPEKVKEGFDSFKIGVELILSWHPPWIHFTNNRTSLSLLNLEVINRLGGGG